MWCLVLEKDKEIKTEEEIRGIVVIFFILQEQVLEISEICKS